MGVLPDRTMSEKQVEDRHPGGPWRKQNSRRGLLLRLVGTLLSIGLLGYLIRAQGWNEFIEVLKRLPSHYFAAAVLLILVSRIFVTLRWLALVRYANVKISFWQAFRLMFMGNFASNFLPSTVGGDLVRLAGAVALGVDAGISTASLVLDRLVGMVGMASFSPYGLYLISRASGDAWLSHGTAMGLVIAIRRLPGINWIYQKLEQFMRSLIASSIGWLRQPKSLVLALLCTYGHMLSIFLIIWVLLKGMNQPLSFLWIGALWSLSYFVSLLPVSINGLGLQEVSITLLYSRFGGVSTEAALALAVLIRMLFLLASLPGVLFLPDILQPLYGAGSPREPLQAEQTPSGKS